MPSTNHQNRSTAQSFLEFDQEQANQQLQLLGYRPGDKIYLTAFFPKDDARNSEDKGRKSNRLNGKEVERWQKEGRGVYVVVNGGGHKADEVTSCRAIFYEHDNLDKESQLLLWETLGLPEPTFQVDTGGKSIHSYWVLENPIFPKEWKKLQTDLLEFADADRKLKNPNRVMRLAGAWHIKGDGTVNRSQIITSSGKRYTFEELRAIIPTCKVAPTEIPRPYRPSPQTHSEWTGREWALSYLNALSSYRADDYDDWLTVGMALHSVDDSLLAEWDNWSRQSPKYTPGCCDKKWKSFKSQGVSLGTLGHMAKQDGWQSPFEKPSGRAYSSSNLNQVSGGSGSGGNGGNGGDGKHPLVALSLRDRVLEILNRNQDRSRRDEAFINLAQTTGVTTREIKELASSLESEVDVEESRTDRKAEIENLLRIGKYQLTLNDYLDPSVTQPLERVAGWMGTTPAAMLTTLYPVIGSLLQVGTRLELIKATDFYAVPVVYTGLVCESGAAKSPAQKTILNPLLKLQDEAEIEYKERQDEYQQELAEWKKSKNNDEPAPEQPVPREYYTTDATSEAIALIQSQQPNHGFLGWFDELPALFKSQGQYKNGRGADGEKILSGRDGTGFKVNRASGKRLVVSQSAYSITGALQPSILRHMMGDFTDANGQWARFLWTVMQVQPAPYPDDAIPFDVSGLLKGIYRRISLLEPQTYKLSPNAQKRYRNWYNELDQLKMNESRQGLRAVYSKMKGDTGVLALLLHCFNGCVNEGSIPELEISEQTMVAAIKLAKYHIGQVKLIHSEGDAANGEMAAIHTKIIQLSERKGWLNAADVRDIDRQTKKQFSANDIRRHFRELETSGFGQTKGDGTRLMWSINKEDDSPPDFPPSSHSQNNCYQTQDNSGQETKTLESITISSVQPFVEKNGCQTQDNSGQTQDSCKIPESITNTDIQPTGNETQDIQDSFAAQEQTQIDPPSGNQINDGVLSFGVLSCPEFESETHNSITASVSTEDKTQDECPESVLSCPELETITPAISVETVPQQSEHPIYQQIDGNYEIESEEIDSSATNAVVTQDVQSNAASNDEWHIGDQIVVGATDLPPSLAKFDGARGTVEVVKDNCSQCLIKFGDESMHIPFRGLRKVTE